MGKAPDEAALLEPADEAMNARFRFEVERLFHFFKGRRNAAFAESPINEQQQFMLFARQHADLSSSIREPSARARRNKTKTPVDVLVWFRATSQVFKSAPAGRCRPNRRLWPVPRAERG